MSFKDYFKEALVANVPRSRNPDRKQGFERSVWSTDEVDSMPFHNFEIYDIKEGLPKEAEPNGILHKTRELATWTDTKTYYMTCIDDTRRLEDETGPTHIAAAASWVPNVLYPYISYFVHYDNNTEDPVWRQKGYHYAFAEKLDKLVNWWIKHKEKNFLALGQTDTKTQGSFKDFLDAL
jgi:hypothetical protein